MGMQGRPKERELTMPSLNDMTVPELVQIISDIRMSAYQHAMATKDDKVQGLASEIQEIVNEKIREERPKCR